MKIIFMGTPDFSVGTMEALMEAGHEVVLAVTQPDKPKGRRKVLQCSPVKEAALAHGVPVYQPRRVREPECVEYLRSFAPDMIVVVAFGQILTREILELPRYCCVNVHASLLPKYRGAAPIQWAILNGETVTGVTTMRMDEGIDTGDMIARTELALAPDETGGSLFDRLAVAGAALCVETVAAIQAGTATYTPQNHAEATYTTMIKKQMGEIDFTKSAREIERLVRGLNPWPSAYTHLGDKTLKIWKASVIGQDSADEQRADKAVCEPGTIIHVSKDSITVQTGQGALSLEEVQLEGKKRMDVASFLRGYPMETGITLASHS